MGKYKIKTESGTYIITTDNTPAQQTPPKPEEKTLGGFISNIPQSAENLVYPFAHPVETAKGVTGLLMSAGTNLSESAPLKYLMNQQQMEMTKEARDKYRPILPAVAGELYNRYRPSNILDTLYEDPLGMATDVLAATKGGAGLVRKGAEAGRLGRTAQIAGKVQKVSEAAQPLNIAGKTIIKSRGLAAKAMQVVLGATTGRGGGAIKEAWKASPEFMRRLRGVGKMEDIVDDMRVALGNLKTERGAKYRSALAKIGESQEVINLSPVYKTLREELQNFNVKMKPAATPGGRPTLDFSRSTIHSTADQAKVNGVFNDLLSWGTKEGDLTPIGVDTLKRRLGDFYADSSQARALIAKVENSVKSQLNAVPGYKEMTRDYNIASDMINKFEKELSLNSNNPGTAVRKIGNLFNQTNDYRESLVEALNKYSGGKRLQESIAGEAMSELFPTGIMRPLMAGGMIAGVGQGLINPAALLALTSTSPRLVGEGAALAGRSSRAINRGIKASGIELLKRPEVYRGAYYATAEERKKK